MVWGSFSLPCSGILSSYTSVLMVWLFSYFVCSHPHRTLEIGLLVFAYLTFHVQCHLCMDRSGVPLFPLLTFLIQLVHCTKGVELSHFPWSYTFLGMSLSLWGAPHPLCPVHIPSTYGITKVMVQRYYSSHRWYLLASYTGDTSTLCHIWTVRSMTSQHRYCPNGVALFLFAIFISPCHYTSLVGWDCLLVLVKSHLQPHPFTDGMGLLLLSADHWNHTWWWIAIVFGNLQLLSVNTNCTDDYELLLFAFLPPLSTYSTAMTQCGSSPLPCSNLLSSYTTALMRGSPLCHFHIPSPLWTNYSEILLCAVHQPTKDTEGAEDAGFCLSTPFPPSTQLLQCTHVHTHVSTWEDTYLCLLWLAQHSCLYTIGGRAPFFLAHQHPLTAYSHRLFAR